MIKEFRIVKFRSDAFRKELIKVASPYRGNAYPILTTLDALAAPPLNCQSVVFELEGMGFSAWSYSLQTLDDCSAHIDSALPAKKRASKQKKEEHRKFVRMIKLADIAYRYIESGLPVIFGTSDHALIGIGHTYDHATAVKAAIQRIPDFIVHNDAAGPYQKMPLFSSPIPGQLHFGEVEDIIAVVPVAVTLRGEQAESMSRQAVANFLDLPTGDAACPTYKDLIYHARSDLSGLLDDLEYRTFLMPSVEFQCKPAYPCRKKDIVQLGGPLSLRKEIARVATPQTLSHIRQARNATRVNEQQKNEPNCVNSWALKCLPDYRCKPLVQRRL